MMSNPAWSAVAEATFPMDFLFPVQNSYVL